MISLELSEGALYDFERRLVFEVIDQVGGEVVGRSKDECRSDRRGQRDASDVGEGHLGRQQTIAWPSSSSPRRPRAPVI